MTRQSNLATKQKGTIYVEAKLNNTGGDRFRIAEIKSGIEVHLRRYHSEVRVGDVAHLGSPLAAAVDRVQITGHSRSRVFPDETFHALADSELDIVVFTLFSHDDQEPEAEEDGQASKDSLRQFHVTELPHEDFEPLWDSLVYDEPVKDLTLRTLMRAIKERSDVPRGQSAGLWQNTVLFYGPPGSGKTTLAQALAQRLSVRLSNNYSHSKFLGIKCSTLLSQYFGESSKRVVELFDTIFDMSTDRSQLSIVFFDEVESIAACRKQSSATSEVADALRATNEIFQGLDRLQKCPNVVFLFASNLYANLDDAFLGRCFIQEFIDAPATDTIYGILRSELNNLIQHGKVHFETLVYDHGIGMSATSGSSRPRASSDLPSTPISRCTAEHGSLFSQLPVPCRVPDLPWANIHWPEGAITAVSELHKIAALAKGLAGRDLRGLVTLARFRHTVDEPCELRDLLSAMELVISKRTQRNQWNAEPSSAAEVDKGMEEYEPMDIATLLAQMEE